MALVASAVLPERQIQALPLRPQLQPAGVVIGVTVVEPVTKPGIGSFITTPVVAAPLLVICRV